MHKIEFDQAPLWLYWLVTVLSIVLAAWWTGTWWAPDAPGWSRSIGRVWSGPVACTVIATFVTWYRR